MGWLDIGIVTVLVGSAIIGFRRGFVRQAMELGGLLVGVLLALYLTGGLVANYAKPLAQYRLTYPVVFLGLVGVSLLLASVLGRVAGEVMQVTFFGMIDHIGGAAAGVLKGAVWLSIWIAVIQHLQFNPSVDDTLRRSSLAGPLSRILPAAYDVVRQYAPEAPVVAPFQNAPRTRQS